MFKVFNMANLGNLKLQRIMFYQMATMLVMVIFVNNVTCGYVLEGSLNGKWHDSGTSFNKQVPFPLSQNRISNINNIFSILAVCQ